MSCPFNRGLTHGNGLLKLFTTWVEDHDDLTPLFTSQNDTLRETYGEYFLAELIEAQDDENVAVVCEEEGKAVGFMSVCSKVNIQLLHDCFDLGPFHGLCKPHPDDLLKLPEQPSDIGENTKCL
ncbi:UNVERIFIED_CONTAM: Cilia- and flagella-associated protein 61 [Gekko kuhli]